MEQNNAVRIEEFAERHFIKNFEKKYKNKWDVTLRAMTASFERIDALLETDKAETISDLEGIKLIKTKFKVAATKESAKTSGNRCIVVWEIENKLVRVLLVYGKTDLSSGNNETAEWKRIIREHYPEYKKHC